MRNFKILFLFLTAFSIVGFVFAKPPVSTNNGKDKGVKNISAGCAPGNSRAFIDLNNVRAIIGTHGGKWEDGGSASYEIPKGSGGMSVYAGGIWVAGVDVNGQLRVAARTFSSVGDDYWPGPLVSKGDNMGNVTPEICNQYDRLWKVDKEMVTTFRSWYESDAETQARDFPGYNPPTALAEWPGNGPDFSEEDNEYDRFLAPFADVNKDGRYSITDGDYPNYEYGVTTRCKFVPERRADSLNNSSVTLYGDQTIWWVYNDRGNIHSETQGAAIGMEVRGQAFAFSTNDELNNMSFYNYQLINRSSYTLNNAFFGVWVDIDLGDATDDLLGCDVNRGLMFAYNETNNDGNGSGITYGANPPSVGFDFFEGPYKDESGLDELTNWARTGDVIPDCQWGYRDSIDVEGEPVGDRLRVGEGDIFNGNINGLNFGDGIVDNERWGMRRFIYHQNSSSDVFGDPKIAIDYYNYLRGIWKDGSRMTYGGNGATGTLGTDFMFPWESDECNWGTGGSDPGDNTVGGWRMPEKGDGRVLTSAGSFQLKPGATNYITFGVPWARDFINGHMGSVDLLKLADDKCQKLFENCFRMIEGPNAPDLSAVELDGKLIFQLSNSAASNNYLEKYSEVDPFITQNYTNRSFKFQGYQVFQLKNKDVTVNQLYDEQFARVVFQCDLEDGVSRLINYSWDANAQANSFAIMVDGENKGIRHSFQLVYDMFGTTGSSLLVNYKKYYYIAIAYAHNNYKNYDQNDGALLNGQKQPYLASRKGSSGEIQKYEFIPQPTYLGSGGIQTNSEYGDIPPISMHSGRGNSINFIDLTDECSNDILVNGSVDVRNYTKNGGPVQVKVVDPLNVVDGDFVLFIEPDSVKSAVYGGVYNVDYAIIDGVARNTDGNGAILNSNWTLVRNGVDTLASQVWMRNSNEFIIPEYGIAINMLQTKYPIRYVSSLEGVASINNGYLGSSKTYSNPMISWFNGFNDQDGQIPFNWIRSGTYKAEGYNDVPGDPNQDYEQILNGTWSPYRFVSSDKYGPGNPIVSPATVDYKLWRLSSVDIVITKDTSKWTRCIVIETSENTVVNGQIVYPNPVAEGGARKFMLRQAPSKNKLGISADTVGQVASTNPNDPNYISASGMSWFPGYAIDVETGERLNMAFGEDSYLIGQNGRDMIWNPTTAFTSIDGTPQFGGKHFIYVFSTGYGDVAVSPFPHYDSGRVLVEAFKPKATDANLTTTLTRIGKAMLNVAWVSIPRISREYQWKEYADMPDSEVKVKIRVANPYIRNMGPIYGNPIHDQINKGYPYFKFSLDGLSAVRNSKQVLNDNLDRINVVPNPYYAHNAYEKVQLDNVVKITNLPKDCVVKIFNVSGTLIREFSKSDNQTWIDWNLTNTSNVPISGGVYIIHVSVPNVGEKVLKWFGVLRPADLSNF